jgi:hypothetical protein
MKGKGRGMEKDYVCLMLKLVELASIACNASSLAARQETGENIHVGTRDRYKF